MTRNKTANPEQEAELELVKDIASYYDDPLGFVLYAFPWGEKGTPLEDHDGPDEWQREQLNNIRERIKAEPEEYVIRDATASGHGIGKSAETAFIILWAISTRPHISGVVTANTQPQLKTKTWRELSVWHKRMINKHWFKWTATSFFHVDHPETWAINAIPNTEHSSESFAGLHAEHVLVIYDEASAIPDKIWEVTEGAMTTPRAMWFVYGNPTLNTGRFRECFGRFRARWRHRQIDSRTAKMTNKKEIDQWEVDHGEDSDFFRVRVKGQFPKQGDTQLISNDKVEKAQQRTVEVGFGTPKIMAVDVARYGNDQSVIAMREGRRLNPLIKLRSMDLMTLSAWVGGLAREYKPDILLVDGIGVGAGVVDKLIELGFPVIEVIGGAATSPENKNKLYNLRMEMWWRMKDWLNTADIPADDQELFQDLISPTYKHDSKRMLMQLESKEEMKKRGLQSPDCGDAVAMTFAYPAAAMMNANSQSLEPEAIASY